MQNDAVVALLALTAAYRYATYVIMHENPWISQCPPSTGHIHFQWDAVSRHCRYNLAEFYEIFGRRKELEASRILKFESTFRTSSNRVVRYVVWRCENPSHLGVLHMLHLQAIYAEPRSRRVLLWILLDWAEGSSLRILRLRWNSQHGTTLWLSLVEHAPGADITPWRPSGTSV